MTAPPGRGAAPGASGGALGTSGAALGTSVSGRRDTARAPGAAARRWLALIAVAGLLAVGIALLTQHVGGMPPCPWCVLQRLEFLAVSALALLGWAVPSRPVRLVAAAGAGLLALTGLATALWQHFVAAASNSCKLTLADRVMTASGLDERWPQVFAAYASCADAKATLLGVRYEFWSAGLFVALAALAVLALRDSIAATVHRD